MKLGKLSAFILSVLLLAALAVPALAHGHHGQSGENGWYSQSEGILKAYVQDADGNILYELPEENDVCPDCRKGICSASDLKISNTLAPISRDEWLAVFDSFTFVEKIMHPVHICSNFTW